ncbi:MAG: GxxExxY protein [Anaerolineae bacterium]
MPNRRSTKGYDFEQLSYDVIGACIDVQRQLGVHCMEVNYQRALELALPKRGLQFQREVEIPIAYDGVVVTKRRVDFVIWNDIDPPLTPPTRASVRGPSSPSPPGAGSCPRR